MPSPNVRWDRLLQPPRPCAAAAAVDGWMISCREVVHLTLFTGGIVRSELKTSAWSKRGYLSNNRMATFQRAELRGMLAVDFAKVEGVWMRVGWTDRQTAVGKG